MDRITTEDVQRLDISVTSTKCDQCKAIIDVLIPAGLVLPLVPRKSPATITLEAEGAPRRCPECVIAGAAISDIPVLTESFGRLRQLRRRLEIPEGVTAYSLVGIPLAAAPRLKEAVIQLMMVRVENPPDEWRVPFVKVPSPGNAPISLMIFGIVVRFPGTPGALELRWRPADFFNGDPIIELVGLPPLDSFRSFTSVKRLLDGLEVVATIKGHRPPGSTKISMADFPGLVTEAYRDLKARSDELPVQADMAAALNIAESTLKKYLSRARSLGFKYPPE